jgi:phosphoserine phosphatase RsbX
MKHSIPPRPTGPVEIGVAQHIAAGQTVCGDGHVTVIDEASCLIGVIDGLGHGAEAHMAAVAARTCIESNSSLSLRELFSAAAEALSATRGACIGLVHLAFERPQIQCAAVGNIEIMAVSKAPIRPFPSRGIVGRRGQFGVQTFKYPLAAGDRVAIFTDGISRRRLDLYAYAGSSPQQAADMILREHGIARDDATCVVFDYVPKRKPCPSRRPPA